MIAILNGPNLNCLGRRNPALYGALSMEQVMLSIQHALPNTHFTYRQSNHEGDLIDWIQQYSADKTCLGIVLNAGGYSHTSIALRDAVEMVTKPVIEVHISDITQRESFRRLSLITDVCAHSIIGQGTNGYLLAVEWIMQHVEK